MRIETLKVPVRQFPQQTCRLTARSRPRRAEQAKLLLKQACPLIRRQNQGEVDSVCEFEVGAGSEQGSRASQGNAGMVLDSSHSD
jgi:hypothetical protein